MDERSELERLITYRVSILSKLIDRKSIRVLSGDYGLKLSQWRILAQLAHHSPASVRFLARKMQMDRADVSRAAAVLSTKRLVSRQPDPTDGRSVDLSITDAGRQLYEQIMPARLAQNERLIRIVGEDDLEGFLNAIDRLTQSLIDQ